MNTMINRFFGNGFRKAALLLTAVSLSGVMYAENPTVKDADSKETMKAVVFQLEDSMKFKAIVENPAATGLRITIKNAENQVVYEDKAGKTATYIRRFDLSSLADGEYSVEITNGKETHKQSIKVETVTARVATVR